MDNFLHVNGVNKFTKSVGGWTTGGLIPPYFRQSAATFVKSTQFFGPSLSVGVQNKSLFWGDFDSKKTHIYLILHVFNLDTVSHYHSCVLVFADPWRTGPFLSGISSQLCKDNNRETRQHNYSRSLWFACGFYCVVSAPQQWTDLTFYQDKQSMEVNMRPCYLQTDLSHWMK